jgi:hypothetical protein
MHGRRHLSQALRCSQVVVPDEFGNRRVEVQSLKQTLLKTFTVRKEGIKTTRLTVASTETPVSPMWFPEISSREILEEEPRAVNIGITPSENKPPY